MAVRSFLALPGTRLARCTEAPWWGVGGALDPTQGSNNLSLLLPTTPLLSHTSLVLSPSLCSVMESGPRHPASQPAHLPTCCPPLSSINTSQHLPFAAHCASCWGFYPLANGGI